MWEIRRVGDDARPAWWRTVVLVLVTMSLSLWTATLSRPVFLLTTRAHGIDALMAVTALVAAVVVPVTLVWRHRYPVPVVLLAGAVSVLLPIGNAVPLVALGCLLARRRGGLPWLVAAGVAVTSAWVTLVDVLAQPRGASFLKTVLGPLQGDRNEEATLAPQVVVGVILGGLALAITAGLLLRWRREATDARSAVRSTRHAVDRLGDQVARAQERERIAREVHDALGHRLSLLTLHAGALEANAQGDDRLARSASLVRESARQALEDLQSLLTVLREPLGTDPPTIPLTELQQVVRDSFGAGEKLASSIVLDGSERAHPTLSRAVYRIVQELLTNARKHAPGEPVLLRVEGGPAKGILIDVRNHYPGSPQEKPPGASRGLTGISERAELLGGNVRYGLDDRGTTFRVIIELPWREAESPA